MSYITLDTTFYRHPKVLALGNTALARTARDLYIAALSYSRDNLTDGFVPLEALGELDPLTPPKAALKAGIALYSVGLFQKKRGRFTGYWINDYGKHQQTKAEVEKARTAAKERKRKERDRRQEVVESRCDSLDGSGVTHPPVTPQEVEVEVEEERSRAMLLLDARFENGKEEDHDKAIEVDKILSYCRDVEEKSRDTLMFYARQVPFSRVTQIRINCMNKRNCGVGYAVNALKAEAKLAAAA